MMSKLNLPILFKSNETDIQEFINFWQPFYAYKNEELYSQNINLVAFSIDNINQLYQWKNGIPLSDLKAKAVAKNIHPKLDKINSLKRDQNLSFEDFNLDFKEISAVWRIFLLHIIKPNEFPIYDQHIHRTYQFIKGNSFDNITNAIDNNLKLNWYKEEYLPFVKEINVPDIKKMDEAFFAFGKFLSRTHYSKMIV